MRFIQTTRKDFKTFKNQAKKLSKETGKKHVECLEFIAQKHGYISWKHVSECHNETKEIDPKTKSQALKMVKDYVSKSVSGFEKQHALAKKGVVLMYDVKEAMDVDTTELFEDDVFPLVWYGYFFEEMIKQNELEGWVDHSAEVLLDMFVEEVKMSYIFFRFKESSKYVFLKEIGAFCKTNSFWVPMGVFVDGDFYDASALEI